MITEALRRCPLMSVSSGMLWHDVAREWHAILPRVGYAQHNAAPLLGFRDSIGCRHHADRPQPSSVGVATGYGSAAEAWRTPVAAAQAVACAILWGVRIVPRQSW